MPSCGAGSPTGSSRWRWARTSSSPGSGRCSGPSTCCWSWPGRPSGRPASTGPRRSARRSPPCTPWARSCGSWCGCSAWPGWRGPGWCHRTTRSRAGWTRPSTRSTCSARPTADWDAVEPAPATGTDRAGAAAPSRASWPTTSPGARRTSSSSPPGAGGACPRRRPSTCAGGSSTGSATWPATSSSGIGRGGALTGPAEAIRLVLVEPDRDWRRRGRHPRGAVPRRAPPGGAGAGRDRLRPDVGGRAGRPRGPVRDAAPGLAAAQPGLHLRRPPPRARREAGRQRAGELQRLPRRALAGERLALGPPRRGRDARRPPAGAGPRPRPVARGRAPGHRRHDRHGVGRRGPASVRSPASGAVGPSPPGARASCSGWSTRTARSRRSTSRRPTGCPPTWRGGRPAWRRCALRDAAIGTAAAEVAGIAARVGVAALPRRVPFVVVPVRWVLRGVARRFTKPTGALPE